VIRSIIFTTGGVTVGAFAASFLSWSVPVIPTITILLAVFFVVLGGIFGLALSGTMTYTIPRDGNW